MLAAAWQINPGEGSSLPEVTLQQCSQLITNQRPAYSWEETYACAQKNWWGNLPTVANGNSVQTPAPAPATTTQQLIEAIWPPQPSIVPPRQSEIEWMYPTFGEGVSCGPVTNFVSTNPILALALLVGAVAVLK